MESRKIISKVDILLSRYRKVKRQPTSATYFRLVLLLIEDRKLKPNPKPGNVGSKLGHST